jgi:hypothetical protein
MAALKVALVSAPGFARCGEVDIIDIGVPPQLIEATGIKAGLVEEADVAHWLPRPQALDHKGKRGHTLVVGGSPGMRGAGRLAAMAALRAGSGLVTLAADGDFDAPDPMTQRLKARWQLDRFDGRDRPGSTSATARRRVIEVGSRRPRCSTPTRST